jgi:MFS superfamily sulfate permease-like transporter
MLGITTIGMLLLWSKFAPKKIKWVPGALVAVAVATAMAQIMSMPVRYVNLPDNLVSTLKLPGMDAFLRLGQLDYLLAAVTLAFVASAETLLSAAAVDQMHDGPRTKYNQELRSQGVGNILAGFLGGLPMTGVIVRSATNVAAGAKTRRSAMLHGAWLLILVALAPALLRMVPTASLAAILVYTGYKLVNPQNVRRLLRWGGAPVAVYAVTVIMIVATDLLTGILTGLALSLLKVIYALSHMDIQVSEDARRRQLELRLKGAATFMRLPKLVDALEKLPHDAEVRVHIGSLEYIDHACLDALSNWEKQRNEKGCRTVVEWDELMLKYRTRNSLRQQPSEPERELAASR